MLRGWSRGKGTPSYLPTRGSTPPRAHHTDWRPHHPGISILHPWSRCLISNACRSLRWSWWWRVWRRRGTSTLASSGRSSRVSSSSNPSSGTSSLSSRRRRTRETNFQVSIEIITNIFINFTITTFFVLTNSSTVMMPIPTRQDPGGALRDWGRFCSACWWGGRGDAPTSLWLLDKKLWDGPISLWLLEGNSREKVTVLKVEKVEKTTWISADEGMSHSHLLLKTYKIWKKISRFSWSIKNAKTVLLCDNTDLLKAQANQASVILWVTHYWAKLRGS